MKENNNGFPGHQKEDKQKQALTAPGEIAEFGQTLENTPHAELVGMFKDMLAKDREDWEKRCGEGTFDPVAHLGNALELSMYPALERGQDAYKQLRQLSLAYDAISEGHLTDQAFRGRVRANLLASSETYGRHVSLAPKAVKLLDAMAEAVDVPRTRGEATVDILRHIPLQSPAGDRKRTLVREFLRQLFTKQDASPPEQTASVKEARKSQLQQFLAALAQQPEAEEGEKPDERNSPPAV